jgi:hypothetical protein
MNRRSISGRLQRARIVVLVALVVGARASSVALTTA